MKFRIDRKYIAIQSLKAIVGYMLGVSIVLYFLDSKDPYGFVGVSLAVCILFFILYFPKKIYVGDGIISFVQANRWERTTVELDDIVKTEASRKIYNTVKLVTKSGWEYTLHPEDAQTLETLIRSRQNEK